MRIIEGKDIDSKLWLELAKQSPVASWFQTKEAYDFFDSLSFLEAFAYAIESDGVLKGVAVGYIQKDGGKLKQFLSRRAIILGGPLLSNDISREELDVLLTTLKSELKRKVIYIETRNFDDYSRWRRFFEECGFNYEPHYDIHVDTFSMDEVNEHLGKSRKRDIRVSLRDGATIDTEPTIAQIRDYYDILKELYLTKIKTPLFPLEYFEKLYAIDASAFLLVKFDGKIVGGTVCVRFEEKALYEMYVCGKDGVYKNIFPSEVATFAGLQYAVEQGCMRFDMMGAGKPGDGGYGVRDFKMKFGGNLMEYGRYVNVCDGFLYFVGKLGVNVLKSGLLTAKK